MLKINSRYVMIERKHLKAMFYTLFFLILLIIIITQSGAILNELDKNW